MAHTRKRIRKLSTAVFRGSRSEYNFDVFPISPSITDAAAVFIFSRRFVDKQGRAHHAVSCVGEARSLVSEIKRHKRAKCVKGSEANVVCVLKEADQGVRSDLVRDISEARSFNCVDGKFKPAPKAAPSAKRPGTAEVILLRSAGKAAPVKTGPTLKPQPKITRAKRGGKVSKDDERTKVEAKGKPKNATSKPVSVEIGQVANGRAASRMLPKTIQHRSRAKVASQRAARSKRAA